MLLLVKKDYIKLQESPLSFGHLNNCNFSNFLIPTFFYSVKNLGERNDDQISQSAKEN